MALTLISRRARTVGFSGEITTAANPTFSLTGEFAGRYTTRFKLAPGVWHIRADFDGTEVFRLLDGSGQEITAPATRVDRVIGVEQDTEFYFAVNNWTGQKGRKVHVMLEEVPPPLRNCVLARLGVALWR